MSASAAGRIAGRADLAAPAVADRDEIGRLVLPTGLTIDGHAAYVSNKGPIPRGGEVLRVKLGGHHH